MGQLRGRIAELEASAQQQQRALATARQQAESLEARLTATELAAARSAAEVRKSVEAVVTASADRGFPLPLTTSTDFAYSLGGAEHASSMFFVCS